MSSPDRLPDFLIIGAAKSGTTTLWEYLNRHPQIFMSALKEPEFFSSSQVYDRGIDWYKALFCDAGENQICGEASTTYSRWPHTLDSPQLIQQLGLTPQFIYIMRHPVDRAFSHYAHHMRLDISMTFEEALDKDSIYVDCSLYLRQIERYLRFFPKESFLFLDFDELRNEPAEALGAIQRHLSVEERDLSPQGESIVANPGGSDHFIRERTTQRLRKIPGVSLLADALPRSWRDAGYGLIKRTGFGKKLDQDGRVSPMKPETRAQLLELFEEPNQELERFLGCTLPKWSR